MYNSDSKSVKNIELDDYYDSGDFIDKDYLNTEFVYDKYTSLDDINKSVIYYTNHN